jgi:hypothetical protein
LGLAAVAALALTALLGAGTSSAAYFNSEQENTTWTGAVPGSPSQHELHFGFGFVMTCKDASFSGLSQLGSPDPIVVTPELSDCTGPMSTPMDWTINGCKYRFSAGKTANLVGSIDIVDCAPYMETKFYNCRIRIGNQENVGTVKYVNTEAGTITAIADLSSITFSTFQCGGFISPGGGTGYTGTYEGEWTISGSSEGIPIPVEVKPVGTEIVSGYFRAEEAPVKIGGGSLNTQSITIASGMKQQQTLGCSSATLTGEAASTKSQAVAFVPSYSGCTFIGQSVSVNMGGCKIELNGGPGEEGPSFAVVGANCASSPITFAQTNCKVTVGPQTGAASVTYTNEGSGKLRSVVANIAASGLTYTATGLACASKGTFSTGRYDGQLSLTATNSAGQPQGISVE